MSALDEYNAALQRLINGKTLNVPKNSKINKDTVALEAGRLRGSIKASRESFFSLIEDIEVASKLHTPKEVVISKQLATKKDELDMV